VHVLTHADAGDDYLRHPADPFDPTVHPRLTSTGWSLWSAVSQVCRRIAPDVVHIQYQSAAYRLHPAINLLPWRLRASRRRPLVCTTFHDLRVPYLFPKAGPLRRQAVLALARGSDLDIVTNLSDWQVLADAGLGARLRPIPIGSNIVCQLPASYDRRQRRASWGAGPDDMLLAYFGFLNRSKGGETLMRTLHHLVREGHPAHLLMVGGQVGSSDPTNIAYLERVRSLIVELGLEDRVHWTGFTSPEEVSINLKACDCALLPYVEGASLRHGSLMAAFAHGLPVVTTLLDSAIRPAVRPAGRQADEPGGDIFPRLRDGVSALLVAPEDPAGLADAVARLMSDHELRATLSEGARQLARQFAWESIAGSHLEAYRGRLSV
jgi:glycosyltransferase involved in cell wall biosynthesis